MVTDNDPLLAVTVRKCGQAKFNNTFPPGHMIWFSATGVLFEGDAGGNASGTAYVPPLIVLHDPWVDADRIHLATDPARQKALAAERSPHLPRAAADLRPKLLLVSSLRGTEQNALNFCLPAESAGLQNRRRTCPARPICAAELLLVSKLLSIVQYLTRCLRCTFASTAGGRTAAAPPPSLTCGGQAKLLLVRHFPVAVVNWHFLHCNNYMDRCAPARRCRHAVHSPV